MNPQNQIRPAANQWMHRAVQTVTLIICCATFRLNAADASFKTTDLGMAQVPSWSKSDLDFFLHGSMSTEFVPESVLKAFIATYPGMFPTKDLSHLGLILDPEFGWPVGFSRSSVPHLGGLPSVGVNCAACHVGEVNSGENRVRVLGMTSHFDAEAFFGTVLGATFQTQDPANMKKFLAAYLAVNSNPNSPDATNKFEARWQSEEAKILATMKEDPTGANESSAGSLLEINGSDLRLDDKNIESADLAQVAHTMLKLFHNMRVSLHFPDQPPATVPPSSGPGRNDAFGALSLVLFGVPQQYTPVKYGLVWNVENRHWVHWDGNTQSPLGRNLLASLGLGAPLIGKQGKLDFANVKRQTDISEKIHPPKYPFAMELTMAKRGAAHFQAKCVSCHGGKESDARLYSPSEIGTQPLRAVLFTQKQADLFDNFLAGLEIPDYKPSSEPGIRSTQKYWAASLNGVWARSPYLHNGSVRTMQELLMSPEQREKSFHRGSRNYDTAAMGYVDEGNYLFDTAVAANSNSGHAYGSDLAADEKRELIEYLKTL